MQEQVQENEQNKGQIHIVVDFSNLFYRAYFAFKKFNTEGEVPVSGLYGSIKILSSLARTALQTKKPFQFHFALDGYPKHRYELFPDYKKRRREGLDMTEEAQESVNLTALMKEEVNATLQLFPSTWYKAEDYEADDVIATVVQQLKSTLEPEDIVWIYSTDQDLCSLIDEQVLVFNKQGHYITQRDILHDYGVQPHKIPMYKAFLGDQSDCLPRIPRIRALTVVQYLAACNSIEEVYEQLEKEETKQNLVIQFKAFRKQVEVNYQLATLQNNIAMDTRIVYPTKENFVKLRQYIKDRKCSSLMSEIKCFFPTSDQEEPTTIITHANYFK